MKIILLILQREYWVRVRKKSFIIMTLLGPLLMASIYVIPVVLAMRDGDKRTIAVIDESGLFDKGFEDSRNISFVSIKTSLAEAKAQVKQDKYYAVLYIPRTISESANDKEAKLFAKKGVSIEVESKVRRTLEDKIQGLKLKQAGISAETLKQIESYNVSVGTASLDDENEQESNVWASSAVGYLGAFMIYIAIFIYGVQVMKGVVEEKTNRIVEVMISSVKPFQLMMGKIIGIALVGLTQFLLWIVLGSVVVFGLSQAVGISGQDMAQQQMELRTGQGAVQSGLPQNSLPAGQAGISKETKTGNDTAQKFMKSIGTINFPKIIACFLFYFLFGYLMYSALFAAVGSAADADTDTQQFMLPITIPLIFSIVIASFVVQNPDSTLAFWASIIPLTSPIIMLIRLPFNPPLWEILLSMALLVLGFIGTTWLAGRIYRVGILMYGKKVNYKELSKWIFYKA